MTRKPMPRLTDEANPKIPPTFFQCQLCGKTFTDICKVYIWQECDDNDKPEEDNYLVVCRSDECQTKINEHPRLYHQVPWGAGKPGAFVLLCGECPWREGWACVHPKLVKNGGEGLVVHLQAYAGISTIICTRSGCHKVPHVAVSCEGLPIDHGRYQAAPEEEILQL